MQNRPDPTDSAVPASPIVVTPRATTEEEEGFLQQLASQQVQHIVVATSNLVSTLIFLLSSAFALVAALAWNKAISDWLPTVKLFDLTDPLAKDFAYALIVTIFAVVFIAILGILNGRVKGKNLLAQPSSK